MNIRTSSAPALLICVAAAAALASMIACGPRGPMATAHIQMTITASNPSEASAATIARLSAAWKKRYLALMQAKNRGGLDVISVVPEVISLGQITLSVKVALDTTCAEADLKSIRERVVSAATRSGKILFVPALNDRAREMGQQLRDHANLPGVNAPADFDVTAMDAEGGLIISGLSADDVKRWLAAVGTTGLLVFIEPVDGPQQAPQKNASRATAKHDDARAPVVDALKYHIWLAREGDGVGGEHIAHAEVSDDGQKQGAVEVIFDDEGKRRFSDMTGAIVNHHLLVVLEDKVISAPRVIARISGGRAMVMPGGADGHNALSEAQEMAAVLDDAVLSVPLMANAVGTSCSDRR